MVAGGSGNGAVARQGRGTGNIAKVSAGQADGALYHSMCLPFQVRLAVGKSLR